MKKVRIEMTHAELVAIRSLLGKCNDTLQVGDIYHKMADKCDQLGLDRLEIKVHTMSGDFDAFYALGQ